MSGFRVGWAFGLLAVCTAVLASVGLALAPAEAPDVPAPIVVGQAGDGHDDLADLRRGSSSRPAQTGGSDSLDAAGNATRIIVADPVRLGGTAEPAQVSGGQHDAGEPALDSGHDDEGPPSGTSDLVGTTPTSSPSPPSPGTTSPPSTARPVDAGPHGTPPSTDVMTSASPHQGDVTTDGDRSHQGDGGARAD